MEVQKSEIRTEKLPEFYKNDYISTLINEVCVKNAVFAFNIFKLRIFLKD